MKKLINILIMNIIIYILLFIIIPDFFMRSVEDIIWASLFILSIVITTGIFYIKKLISKLYLLISLPILSFFIFQFNTKDIYGLGEGKLFDITPLWFDSIMMAVIIYFIQIVTTLLCDIYFKIKNKKITLNNK